jgi:hypothetical protein
MSAREALSLLLGALQEPTAGDAAEGLLPLAAALLSQVTSRPLDTSAAPSGLQVLVLRSVVARTDGRLDAAVLSRLAAVVEAFLPPRDRTRVAELAGPPVSEGVLLSARGAPALRVVVRDPYPGPVTSEAASLAAVEVAPEGPDVAPSNDVAPPAAKLGPLELPTPPRASPVTLAEPPPPPLTLTRFYEGIVEDALEAIRGFARDRWEAPASERPYVEGRILRAIDAVAVTGGPLVSRIAAAWTKSLALPGTHQTFAATLALASLSGGDALWAVLAMVESLVEEQLDHGFAAAEALLVAPHPSRSVLLGDLEASTRRVARATATYLSGRLGTGSAEDLRRALLDSERGRVLAALRAADGRTREELDRMVPVLERWLLVDDGPIAYQAALALLRAGSRKPLDALRSRDSLARTLGLRALDLLVLAGTLEDAPLFAALAGRYPPTPEVFRAVGRFGHPGALARLTHTLGNEDLADAAADALETLFGAVVPPGERLVAGAWQSGVRKLGLAPDVRARVGRPFSPAVVAEECEGGMLSCAAIDSRLLEISIRTGTPVCASLDAFWPEADPSLRAALAAARALDTRFPRGTYHVA